MLRSVALIAEGQDGWLCWQGSPIGWSSCQRWGWVTNNQHDCTVTDNADVKTRAVCFGETRDVFGFGFYFSVMCVSAGAATVISPLELIRTKLQAEKQSYRQVMNCILFAVQREGWRSLWRGFGATLLRDLPFSAMYWYNYEKGKIWLCKWYQSREPTFAITFTSGAVSGSVSASVAFRPA